MKLFTLEEANALIPKLQATFTEIHNLRTGLSLLEPYLRPARERAQWGGGSAQGVQFVRLTERFGAILRRVEAMGVLLKDLDDGLFDFPYRLDGRIVLLCWKHGEDQIDWYHDIDTGFAGRKPLPKGPERFA